MSIKVQSWVWENSKAEGSALLLLLAIADHAHDDGTGAWPSVETLAHKCRQTRRNTQLLLRKLEEQGELLTETGGGPHGCNSYVIPMGDEKITQAKSGARGMKTSAEKARQISPEPSLTIMEPSKREETPKAMPKEPELDPLFANALQTLSGALLPYGGIQGQQVQKFNSLWDDFPDAELHRRALSLMLKKADRPNYNYYEALVRSGAQEFVPKSRAASSSRKATFQRYHEPTAEEKEQFRRELAQRQAEWSKG